MQYTGRPATRSVTTAQKEAEQAARMAWEEAVKAKQEADKRRQVMQPPVRSWYEERS